MVGIKRARATRQCLRVCAALVSIMMGSSAGALWWRVAYWKKKEYVPSMRYLMLWLTLLPTRTLAQELSVEDRACITAAAAKLPPVTALKIEGSRVVAQPSAQGQREIFRMVLSYRTSHLSTRSILKIIN
jgi:hypothetical protein